MKNKIMLVEDDEPILDMMDILLRRIGYEPILVPDVMEALERVRRDPPSLILLDIMMTPMNGWEFLERLRSEYRYPGTAGDPLHRVPLRGREDRPAERSLPRRAPETRLDPGTPGRPRTVPRETAVGSRLIVP